MRVIPPVIITADMISFSTLVEPAVGETIYDTTTTFAKNTQAISQTTHKVYQSLQDGNLNKPLPVWPEVKTDWWMEVGATNKMAMFDLARNTKSVGTSPMTVTFQPGVRVDSIGVLGMEADSVTVTMSSGGSPVYSYTKTLTYRHVNDGKDYCFNPFARYASIVQFDLPPYSDGIITVTLTAAVGEVKCGSIVVGSSEYLGETQFDAVSDAINFSTVTRDIWSKATLVPRPSIPKTAQVTEVDASRVKRLYDLRKKLNAVPALWSALDDATNDYFEVLLILGIYQRFIINVKNPKITTVNLELEEI